MSNEQSYVQGNRAAWLTMLRSCLANLGFESSEAKHAAWIAEREEAIAMLRGVCEDFGDNEWKEDLHLADIIEKHLARHLHAAATDADEMGG